MKYTGGKYFIGKQLSEVMKDKISVDQVDGYLEPFCGALSVLIHMNDTFKCSASDYHPDLVELWKQIQSDTFVPPETVDETFYHECKKLKSPNALKAFAGFGLSFGGKFFAGYADKHKGTKKENFLAEATNSLKKLAPKIQNVDFQCCEYHTLNPHNKLIYCDPPYQFTKYPIKYRTDTKKYDIFDNEKFWEVMRKWSLTNFVFVSETSAPDDFISVWNKKCHRSASQSEKTRYKSTETDKFKTEHLFVHKSVYDRLI